ncbi:MAG TPA: hypothetical protein VN704_05865 [Verrucomicrobiae bacterium]|nr:hypothetical protein [Verrucomicrobiae bacterium]
MVKHTFRFTVEGGDHLDFDLTKEQFDKLSEFCEKELPELKWKTKALQTVEV